MQWEGGEGDVPIGDLGGCGPAHCIYAESTCLPHVFLNQSLRYFLAGVPAIASRSRVLRMASPLDPFVEMEGLRPHLRVMETLGWGVTLHCIRTIHPQASDGSSWIEGFLSSLWDPSQASGNPDISHTGIFLGCLLTSSTWWGLWRQW